MEAARYLAQHSTRKVANEHLNEFKPAAVIVELYPELGTPEPGDPRIYPSSKFKYSLVCFEAAYGPLILADAPRNREPRYWKSSAISLSS